MEILTMSDSHSSGCTRSVDGDFRLPNLVSQVSTILRIWNATLNAISQNNQIIRNSLEHYEIYNFIFGRIMDI